MAEDAAVAQPLTALNFMAGLLLSDTSGERDLDSMNDDHFEESLARNVLQTPLDSSGRSRRLSDVSRSGGGGPASLSSDDEDYSSLLDNLSSPESELLPPLTWELSRCLEYDDDYDAEDLEELVEGGPLTGEDDAESIDDVESVNDENLDSSAASTVNEEDEGLSFTHAEPSILNLAALADRRRSEHPHSPKETIAQHWSHHTSAEGDPVVPSSISSDAGSTRRRGSRVKTKTRFGSTGSIPSSELQRLSASESYVPPRLSPLTTPPEHLELDASGRLPPSLRAAYHEEEVSRAISATVLMCPLFGFLQLTFLYNDQLYFGSMPFYPRLMTIRLGTASLFFLVALRAYLLQLQITNGPKLRTDDPWISNARIVLTWATFGLAAANTDAIILSMPNPATSPYWVGFTLILLSLFLTRPFSYRPLIEFASFIVFQHLFFTWWFDPEGARQPAFTSRAIFLTTMVVVGGLGSAQLETLRRMEFLARKDLRRQKDWSALLLHSVLPSPIARELEASGRVLARDVEDATILFTDFVGFTSISAATAASDLVKALDRLFAVFDIIISRHRLEKLKTIGDAYMCAAGLVDVSTAPHAGFMHLIDSVLAAMEMIGWLESGGFRPKLPTGESPEEVWKVRIGIHRGPVTAGVIGRSRFAYDCWGSTVNIASRLEGSSVPGRINVAAEVYSQLDHLFIGEQRGKIAVKNLPFGEIEQTFIDRIRPEYSLDEQGRLPNGKFWEIAKQGPRKTFDSHLGKPSAWRSPTSPVTERAPFP